MEHCPLKGRSWLVAHPGNYPGSGGLESILVGMGVCSRKKPEEYFSVTLELPLNPFAFQTGGLYAVPTMVISKGGGRGEVLPGPPHRMPAQLLMAKVPGCLACLL